MAILLNIISSGARKSAGAATFRRVRGRTIFSQKRGKNTDSFFETRAAAGLVRSYREAVFYIMSAFCDGMQNSINQSFEPTKYGSRRNAFFKLNYSAVELALNGSELGLAVLDQVMHNVSFTGVSVTIGGTTFTIYGFDVSGWDVLMGAAAAADVSTGAYIRSNIGATIVHSFDETWTTTADPGTATISEMTVSVGTATDAGQPIQRIVIGGTNINYPPTFSIRVGSATSSALAGSWNNNAWTPSGDSASRRWIGTYTIYITDDATVKYSRDVVFVSNGAGGE